MKNDRRLSGLLIAAAALIGLIAVAYQMVWPTKDESAPSSASVNVDSSSRLWGSNPFATGKSQAPLSSPAQSDSANTAVFTVNEKGELILDYNTKIRLDIVIAGLPQNPTRHELQAVEASATAGLQQKVMNRALSILNNYILYVKAEAELNAEFVNANAMSPEKLLDKIVALRRQHLGAQVADSLFVEQEAQDRHGIQVIGLETDPKLTPQEKIARIDALQRALPKGFVNLDQSLDASRSSLMLEAKVAELRQQGASETQVRQLREQQIGIEGAKSIGEMEEQKMRWESRQQEFAQQKNVITQMSISEQQKQERIELLLHRLYSEQELPAARVYLQVPGSR